YPIDESYIDRKPIYQLYYLLNFSHRFHKHYVALTKAYIEKILVL
ncbi:TPA: fructosamine kinase family protein, partial [Pasteurella multocida]|nr:fructosamine kinase family protein [Pasteurella multocida]